VERVLFGENGVTQGFGLGLGSGEEPGAGRIVVDMSSISPIETRKFAANINKLGCEYVDAPVSGGDIGAKNATLTIMVGASEPVFEKVRSILELMGKTITLIGPNGTGQVCKIANQIIVALTIEAVGEGLLFASRAGADPSKVRQALMGGFASSRVLEVHGERMIKRTFEPGFRIELHRKDLDLALSNARALGISLPNTATVQELFNGCIAHGGARWDSAAMVKMLEKLANHEIQAAEEKPEKLS
jgi:2-hydroxy-3-oxopropionate reductase